MILLILTQILTQLHCLYHPLSQLNVLQSLLHILAFCDHGLQWGEDLITRKRIGNGREEHGLYILDQTDQPAHSSIQLPSTKVDIWSWHRRLRHPSFLLLKHLFLSVFEKNNVSDFQCESCQLGKQHRASFAPSINKSLVLFSLIHSDVWGPSRFVSLTG
ncbi:unnamed protein product [Camellia sinensis]